MDNLADELKTTNLVNHSGKTPTTMMGVRFSVDIEGMAHLVSRRIISALEEDAVSIGCMVEKAVRGIDLENVIRVETEKQIKEYVKESIRLNLFTPDGTIDKIDKLMVDILECQQEKPND